LILACEGAYVGNAFRRTGVTLKEGRRDEHGMEEVDGLFSSPEKSPTQLNGFEDDESDDSAGSEMSIDEGRPAYHLDISQSSALTFSISIIRQCAWPYGLS